MKKAQVHIVQIVDFPPREDAVKLLKSLPALLQFEIDRYKTTHDFYRSLLSKLLLQKLFNERQLQSEFVKIQKNEFGKYYVPGDIEFSISHAANKVIVAIAEKVKIGVDVEQKSKGSLLLAERFFCEEEVEWIKGEKDIQEAFTHIWTRKEALVKAAGTGIRMPLKSFNVLAEGVDFIGEKYFLQSDLHKNTSDTISVATNEKITIEILVTNCFSVF